MKTFVVVVVLAALTLSAASAAPAVTSPKLTLVVRAPLTVHGTGFAPGELVTVSTRVSNRARKVTVRAGIRGGFRATISFASRPCSGTLAIKAVGARGDAALLRLPASVCVPPPID